VVERVSRKAVVLRGPRTLTREDVVEIHLPAPLIDRLTRGLLSAAPVPPGPVITLRAFP
jgi:hypothetical protein